MLLLDEREQLLDDVSLIWLTCEVVPLEASVDRFVLFPVSLVSDLLELEVSDLLDLVMIDDQTLTVVSLATKSLLGNGASVWLLEADESKGVVLETLLESYLFDLSIGLEEVGKVDLSPGSWEVLDIKVASLLGVLVSDGFNELLFFSVLLVQEVSEVHFKAIAHVFVGKGGDCFLNSHGTVHLILSILVFITHETILADVVLEENEIFDVTKWGEESSNLVSRHIGGNILEVQVVNFFFRHFSGILWVERENFTR